MILIIGEDGDVSVDQVCYWLLSLGKSFFRINQHDKLSLLHYSQDEKETYCMLGLDQDRVVDSRNLTGYWYRRGLLQLPTTPVAVPGSGNNYDKYIAYNAREQEHTLDAVYTLLQNNVPVAIGEFWANNINKLTVQQVAHACGLRTPDTIVTSSVYQVRQFLDTHGKIITKPIRYNSFDLTEGDTKYFFSQGTKLFPEQLLAELEGRDEAFYPSLFQKYIDKVLELRVFFLVDRFYTMAIFSQDSASSSIDWRDEDPDAPSRLSPFELPKEYEEKLTLLMKRLGLSTGSIDLIFDGHDYIFLEVNPVGQFEWLSSACNYQIERAIALKLSGTP